MNSTKTWKRILSILLVVTLLLSVTPIGEHMDVSTHAASTEAMTLYFQNNWNWTDVRGYYWTSSGNNGAFPGKSLTKVDKVGNYDIYSFEIPAGTVGVIFSGIKNDGSGVRDQSPDIKSFKTGVYYYMIWNNGNAYGTTAYTPPATSYTVTATVSNITFDGKSSASSASNYTATLTADDGYHLPDSITVKAGTTTLSASSGYSYNSSTGALTIYAASIKGNITISATAEEDYYTVVGSEALTGSNWDTTDSDNIMTKNSDGTYTLSYTNVPAGTYEIKCVRNGAYANGEWPYSGNKTVTVDETSKVIITLNPSTNELDVAVISLVSHYEVTFNGTNISSNGASFADDESNYTATLTAAAGFHLPSSITVAVNGTTLSTSKYTYNSTSGALTIPASVISGNIVITAQAEPNVYIVAGSKALTGSNWSTTDTKNQMTANTNGIYTIVYNSVSAGTYEFKITENGNWKWPEENYVLNLANDAKVTIKYDPVTNTGSVVAEKILAAGSVYYVDADIVDYINDNRVSSGQIYGYYNDNQGIWNTPGDAPYSYLNHLISEQASDYYENAYTYPLYFGPLNYIESRYSCIFGNDTEYSLSDWNSAVNTAIADNKGKGAINSDAVIQGLVHNRLINGNLADPVTKKPLLYFDQTAADEWTNNDHPVMAYYADLQFPFKTTYDKVNRVTTYSYNSATDYAVYYDYSNKQLYASDTHILDSINDGNSQGDDYGFYPLNEPDDQDNEVNNGFGIKFSIDFTVGENGLLANDEHVTFDFTGDDDVWVFIDGVLVLDMGGAHAMANGKIDFHTQSATVTDAYTVNPNATFADGKASNKLNSYQGLSNSYIYDDIQERAAVGSDTASKSFSDLGLTNFDYDAIHTMTVFYMERGMVESNFSMEFTMVPVPSGLTISKELNESEINAGILEDISGVSDYDFSMTATSPSTTTSVAFHSYTLTQKFTGKATVTLSDGTTTGGGNSKLVYKDIIEGITNYTYAHSFVTANGDDAFIPGTHFEISETFNKIFSYTNDTTWTVYDAKDGYSEVDSGSGTTADFTMGSAEDTTAYSYAVVFYNNMKVGMLNIAKQFSDSVLKNSTFQFKVYLDLDGAKGNFQEALYENLVYTVDGTSKTAENGIITLGANKTAVISGIPEGATYRVEEITSSDDPWTLTSSSGTTGTISSTAKKTASFTNTVKSSTMNKVIFIEAGNDKNTPYTIMEDITDEDTTLTNLSVSNPSTGLSVSAAGSILTINGQDPNKVYTVTYSGRRANGEIVTGTITVYTYAATEKVYVFDFGLSANLTANNDNGDGLFQKGNFYNSRYNGTTKATLISLTPADSNTQTTVTASLNGTIGTDGSYSDVTFSPIAFMSQVETYEYTVRISVTGQTFDSKNPETGTTLTGSIKIMPANMVYYEDDFNILGADSSSNKIIYPYASSPENEPTLSQSSQSIDQKQNYGYDKAYLNGYKESNGSATKLVNGQYAYFTFYGTGFDLISRTNSDTAGFGVYVFSGEHKQSNLDYINTFTGPVPKDMVFVDNYYNNGDLYQVPVVSVRLDTYGQYTVYMEALATSYTITDVYVDGIRIYNPLVDTSLYPLKCEQDVSFDELRELYGIDKIVHLAGLGSYGLFTGLGKESVVKDALANASIVENMKGETIVTTGNLSSIYTDGPNNEMYLPKNFGIAFKYTVNSSDWTMQIGAKAVSALGTEKSFTVYACVSGTGEYKAVDVITLSSTTDLYYDLSGLKTACGTVGNTYDIIIISNSNYKNNEFVSLTTVKHSGVTLS